MSEDFVQLIPLLKTHAVSIVPRSHSIAQSYFAVPGWVAKFLTAAISALASSKQDKMTRDWQDNVSKQLDEINNKLDEIANELLVIGAAIKQNPVNTVVLFFRNNVETQRKIVEDIAGRARSGPLSKSDRDRAGKAFEKLQEAIYSLENYSLNGFFAYPAAVSGTLTAMLAARLSGSAHYKVDMADVKKRLTEYLNAALDQNDPSSLAAAYTQAAHNLRVERDSFARYLGHWWLVTHQHEREVEEGEMRPVRVIPARWGVVRVEGRVDPFEWRWGTEIRKTSSPPSFETAAGFPYDIESWDQACNALAGLVEHQKIRAISAAETEAKGALVINDINDALAKIKTFSAATIQDAAIDGDNGK